MAEWHWTVGKVKLKLKSFELVLPGTRTARRISILGCAVLSLQSLSSGSESMSVGVSESKEFKTLNSPIETLKILLSPGASVSLSHVVCWLGRGDDGGVK